MKDICGNEIKAGQMVHVWWPKFAGAAENYDFLCTVVRTRGRGIKFVADDGQEFTTDYLFRHTGADSNTGQSAASKGRRQEDGRSVGRYDYHGRVANDYAVAGNGLVWDALQEDRPVKHGSV